MCREISGLCRNRDRVCVNIERGKVYREIECVLCSHRESVY